jgi:hypothetical protein
LISSRFSNQLIVLRSKARPHQEVLLEPEPCAVKEGEIAVLGEIALGGQKWSNGEGVSAVNFDTQMRFRSRIG